MKQQIWNDASNPIVAAVMPLKNDAMDNAEKFARKLIAKVLAEMAAAGWNLDIAAPRPKAYGMGRTQYQTALAKHSLYNSLTTFTEAVRSILAPNIRKQCDESEARFIKETREIAAEQYDAFVCKLIGKIGDVTSATLKGSHVWGYSFLTVAKADGTNEVWKTQTIVNMSKYGKVFNQFPSRKQK